MKTLATLTIALSLASPALAWDWTPAPEPASAEVVPVREYICEGRDGDKLRLRYFDKDCKVVEIEVTVVDGECVKRDPKAPRPRTECSK